MPLPQLIEEDLRVLDEALQGLVTRSEASLALLLDKAGFLIAQAGEAAQFDTTTLGALAAGSFAATQGMAALTRDTNFNSVFQQGDTSSLLILSVDENCLVVVVFKADISVGAVKYYAASSLTAMAAQLEKARLRQPDRHLDLSALNVEDTTVLFQRKRAEAN